MHKYFNENLFKNYLILIINVYIKKRIVTFKKIILRDAENIYIFFKSYMLCAVYSAHFNRVLNFLFLCF